MQDDYLIIIITLIICLLFIFIYYIRVNEKKDPPMHKSAEYPSLPSHIVSRDRIVEISLTSESNDVEIGNHSINMFNYNSLFPGPLIEAQKGDILLISYFNKLPEISNITFHGIYNDENEIIFPNDKFTYRLVLNNAGLFYYHSSVKNQLSKGLFGAILVHDNSDLPYTEKVLVFSTIKINENETLYLTNGVHNGSINCCKGSPIRLRMVNCDSNEIMKISIENHDILKIGGDQGLNEKSLLIKTGNLLILSPGERLDIIFVPRSNNIRIYTKNIVLVTLNTTEEENQYLEIPIQLKNIKKIYVDQCTPMIPIEYGPNSIYSVNGLEISFNNFTKKHAPIVFENCTYLIEITNPLEVANNFYIEKYTFQHIDTIFTSIINSNVVSERIVNKIIENKDTIYIPPRPGDKYSKTVVRLAIEFKSKSYTEHSCIFQSNLLTYTNNGQKAFLLIIPESKREKYLSSSSYINYYSSYFPDSSHTTCLTKPLLKLNPNSSNLDSNESNSSNLDSNEANSSNLDSSNLDSSNLDSSNLDSSNLDSSNLDSSNLDSSNLDSSNLDSSNLDSSNLDSNNLDSNKINLSNLDSNKINLSNLDSNKINVNRINVNKINSNKINVNRINVNRINSNKINVNRINVDKINVNNGNSSETNSSETSTETSGETNSSESSHLSNSDDLTFLSDINSITKNLQHCICRNGLIHKKCRYCINSKKGKLKKRLDRKMATGKLF